MDRRRFLKTATATGLAVGLYKSQRQRLNS